MSKHAFKRLKSRSKLTPTELSTILNLKKYIEFKTTKKYIHRLIYDNNNDAFLVLIFSHINNKLITVLPTHVENGRVCVITGINNPITKQKRFLSKDLLEKARQLIIGNTSQQKSDYLNIPKIKVTGVPDTTRFKGNPDHVKLDIIPLSLIVLHYTDLALHTLLDDKNNLDKIVSLLKKRGISLDNYEYLRFRIGKSNVKQIHQRDFI